MSSNEPAQTTSDEPKPIPFADLTACEATLRALADNYRAGAPGWRTLVQARRLVRVELQVQYGETPEYRQWQEAE